MYKLRISLTQVPSSALHVTFLPFVVPLPPAEASGVAKILTAGIAETMEGAAG